MLKLIFILLLFLLGIRFLTTIKSKEKSTTTKIYKCPHCGNKYPERIALDIIKNNEKYICNKCGEINSKFKIK